MPTLNKRYVKESRKTYYCDDCGRIIPQGSSYLYLYGMAEISDKPYPLRICLPCDEEFKAIQEMSSGKVTT